MPACFLIQDATSIPLRCADVYKGLLSDDHTYLKLAPVCLCLNALAER
ncbi:hypothetical protein ALP45_101738 [Pseudomonas coronafaciens pv. atropurpurea]|nr:hypothetical protein ALO66_101678 [Pseudomonas coronafaciens pv. atropurpurea]RMT60510.1 hypothetical protein ALP45_101738 [Pseudomonas coronafaciens pv. atropurpurea]